MKVTCFDGNFSSVSRRMRCDVKTVRAAWRRLGDDILKQIKE